MPASSSVQIQKKKGNRVEERVSVVLPVTVRGRGTGVTRNISATGMYFEADFEPKIGDVLEIGVGFAHAGGGLTLCCRGLVVRYEPLGSLTGVATQIFEPTFEAT